MKKHLSLVLASILIMACSGCLVAVQEDRRGYYERDHGAIGDHDRGGYGDHDRGEHHDRDRRDYDDRR